jgi:hypothetical protein
VAIAATALEAAALTAPEAIIAVNADLEEGLIAVAGMEGMLVVTTVRHDLNDATHFHRLPK